MTGTPLNVHLNTDRVTGELQIDFDPPGEHTIPVGVAEWPDVRSALRERVREQLENVDGWKAHLDSNRVGERLDVRAGKVYVDDSGDIQGVDMEITGPEEVNW